MKPTMDRVMPYRSLGILLLMLAMHAFQACSEQSGEGEARAVDSGRQSSEEGNRVERITSKILEKPNNPNLYISRALAYADEQKYNLALRDVDRALSIDSTVSFFYATKGELYFLTRDLRSARLSLERAIEYDDENIEALLKLGEVLFLLRRYPESISRIDDALRIKQRLPKAYFLKGYIFKELGDTTRSISSFQTATEVDPEYFEAFMELGHLYAYRKDPIALEYLNTALEINPKSAEAWYQLGLFYQSQGMLDEAADAYESLVREDPGSFLGYYNLGYLYLTETERYDIALAYFDSVLAVQPAALDALYNKGVCYEEMGRTQTAHDVFREVLSMDPQHTLAAKGVERTLP